MAPSPKRQGVRRKKRGSKRMGGRKPNATAKPSKSANVAGLVSSALKMGLSFINGDDVLRNAPQVKLRRYHLVDPRLHAKSALKTVYLEQAALCDQLEEYLKSVLRRFEKWDDQTKKWLSFSNMYRQADIEIKRRHIARRIEKLYDHLKKLEDNVLCILQAFYETMEGCEFYCHYKNLSNFYDGYPEFYDPKRTHLEVCPTDEVLEVWREWRSKYPQPL